MLTPLGEQVEEHALCVAAADRAENAGGLRLVDKDAVFPVHLDGFAGARPIRLLAGQYALVDVGDVVGLDVERVQVQVRAKSARPAG